MFVVVNLSRLLHYDHEEINIFLLIYKFSVVESHLAVTKLDVGVQKACPHNSAMFHQQLNMVSAGNTFAAAAASRPSATNGYPPCPANVNSTCPGHPMQPNMPHRSAGFKDSANLQHTEQAQESNSVHPTQGVEIDDDGFSQAGNCRVER